MPRLCLSLKARRNCQWPAWREQACASVPGCRHLIVMTIDPTAASPVDRSLTLGQVIDGQPSIFESCATAPDDTAVMLYTSGTTGQPKGAELTHVNMTMNAMASRDMILPLLGFAVDARMVSLITLPLFHSTGQTGADERGHRRRFHARAAAAF